MNNGKYHYYTDRDRAAWICAERHIQAYEGGKPVLRWRRWNIVLDIPDKKLDNPVLGKKVLKISGMHCEHCAKAVTEAINKIDGASAKVKLSENEAVVSYDRELDEEQLKRIVKDAGYRVVSIK